MKETVYFTGISAPIRTVKDSVKETVYFTDISAPVRTVKGSVKRTVKGDVN